jgi:photosystem II stability/assembly factor-like uncharacterized protein
MKSALIITATLGSAMGASWSNDADVASATVGVGAGSADVAFVAAGANGVGAEVLTTTDGGKTFTSDTISGVLFLDAGARGPTSAVANGLFGASYSTDGKTFKGSSGGGGQGQSVEGFGTNSYGIAGAFGGAAGGVAVSNDGGKSFKSFPCDALDAQHPARYAAFPTADTWYISAGAWPTHSEAEKSDEKSLFIKSLNERVQIRKDRKTGEHFYHYVPEEMLASPNNVTQYTGAIAKTTDGGKTWKKVFQKDGSFYFNGIHCHSEDHCIAVAEGHNCQPAGSYIYVTKDGGATWNMTHNDVGGGATLMGARMVSDTEGWAAGGLGSSFSFEGRFYHTTDGGSTWTKEALKGMLAMGIDCFDANNCFAPGIGVDRQGAVASYH